MKKKLVKRRRNNGYTVSLYATDTGYLVTLSDASDPTHREYAKGDKEETNRIASRWWDAARDDYETKSWEE